MPPARSRLPLAKLSANVAPSKSRNHSASRSTDLLIQLQLPPLVRPPSLGVAYALHVDCCSRSNLGGTLDCLSLRWQDGARPFRVRPQDRVTVRVFLYKNCILACH